MAFFGIPSSMTLKIPIPPRLLWQFAGQGVLVQSGSRPRNPKENWRIIPQIFLTILSSSSHLRWFRKVTGYPWVPPWQPMRNPRSRDPSCKAWLQWVMWQVQLQALPSRPSRGPPCANRLPCRHRWASTEDCTRLDVTPHPGQKIAGPSLRMASPRIGTGWSSLLVFLAERMPSVPCFWHLQKINQKVFWYSPILGNLRL